MHNPLRYQISEYDCGPTSMLNAISYLFPRESLSPDIIRSIMLFCLDSYGPEGDFGKSGTSCMAMMFLSNWLNGYGQTGRLPVSSQYITGEDVHFSQNSYLRDALRRGGAVVAQVYAGGRHFVTMTGIVGDDVYCFDPYYEENPGVDPRIRLTDSHPCEYNRMIPVSFFESEDADYSFGPLEKREVVILFNNETKLTQEKTVEYII